MTVQRASGGIDYMNLAEFEIVTSESLHQPIKSDVFKWNTVSDEELSQECPELVTSICFQSGCFGRISKQ